MSIEKTLDFFKVAKPNPTQKDILTQIGAHTEEVLEMYDDGLGVGGDFIYLMRVIKDYYYKGYDPDFEESLDKKALLDSLADQIVTATGIAYMLGMDIQGALNEVADSNLSKYVYVGDRELTPLEVSELNSDCSDIEAQGRYVGVHWKRIENYVVFFDGSGKILKSPRNYFEPQLDKFLGVNNEN